MTAGDVSARVLLVRHAPTTATRAHRFPGDEPLDDEGRRLAQSLVGRIVADRAVTSPARRCRETATMAGFAHAAVDDRFAELDWGLWAGHHLDELFQRDPARVEAWLDDPSVAPTDGEGLPSLRKRVAQALCDLAADGTTVVFTHGGPIKAAVLDALNLPVDHIWRLDIPPCSVTELRADNAGSWSLASPQKLVATWTD